MKLNLWRSTKVSLKVFIKSCTRNNLKISSRKIIKWEISFVFVSLNCFDRNKKNVSMKFLSHVAQPNEFEPNEKISLDIKKMNSSHHRLRRVSLFRSLSREISVKYSCQFKYSFQVFRELSFWHTLSGIFTTFFFDINFAFLFSSVSANKGEWIY